MVFFRLIVFAASVLPGSLASAAVTPAVPGHFTKARFVTIDGRRIGDAQEVTVTHDSVTFRLNQPRVPKSGLPAVFRPIDRSSSSRPRPSTVYAVDVPQLRYIEVRTGNNAGKYALMGAGVGLLGAISAIVQVNRDPISSNSSNDVNSGAVIAIMTLGFAGIGALIGSSNDVYSTVRKANQWVSRERHPIMAAGKPERAGMAIVALQLKF